MADCKNWEIVKALITQLQTITTENHYNTNVAQVFIPKKVFKILTYPAIAVFFDEDDNELRGFVHESGLLDILLVYIDGKDDNNETESYIERYKNVGADIQKCLMGNPSLNGLCEFVNISAQRSSLFIDDNNIIMEAHVTELKINRTINMKDPYQ